MDRIYLCVPPEEHAAVHSAGAHWDERLGCWYLTLKDDPTRFSRWPPTRAEDAAGFAIISHHAHVAATTRRCDRCREPIEVICIHCDDGTAVGQPLRQFTVSNVWAVDSRLDRQLTPWPGFRPMTGLEGGGARFANHCSRCSHGQGPSSIVQSCVPVSNLPNFRTVFRTEGDKNEFFE